MLPLEVVGVLLAGVAAGTINAVVGSGTLVTFPTLLAFGVPPVTANVSNTVGLAPGSLTAAWGYRQELTGQRDRLLWLGSASLSGAVTGALLLLWLPESAFDAIVPVLVGLGCVLVVLQPRISAKVAHLRRDHAHGGPAVWVTVFLTGIYGGYFGAAQGVLLIAVLGIGLDETLQRVNAAKNVLAGLVNAVAAVVFVLVADVSWAHAGLLAVGSILGGYLGARVGRRLPSYVFRLVIVVIGVVAIVSMLR